MRLQGWEARLIGLLEQAEHGAYELGVHDCFRLACRVIEALTGADRWPEFAGYSTRREALRRIADYGGSFLGAFDRFFGAAGADTRQARRGDIVAIQTADGDLHLGVCMGAQAAFLAPGGLLRVPTLTCICCWRIG